jgi:hypothetical protein
LWLHALDELEVVLPVGIQSSLRLLLFPTSAVVVISRVVVLVGLSFLRQPQVL